MSDRAKITDAHRRRRAVVYVRQSTPAQLERNHESRARQYALRDRAVELGWPAGAVTVVDGGAPRIQGTGRGGRARAGRAGAGVGGLAVRALVGGLASVAGPVRADGDADRRLGRDLLAAGLQRSAVARLEGHDVRGRAASDPLAAGRWAAQQGQARRARAEPAGRAGSR